MENGTRKTFSADSPRQRGEYEKTIWEMENRKLADSPRQRGEYEKSASAQALYFHADSPRQRGEYEKSAILSPRIILLIPRGNAGSMRR